MCVKERTSERERESVCVVLICAMCETTHTRTHWFCELHSSRERESEQERVCVGVRGLDLCNGHSFASVQCAIVLQLALRSLLQLADSE